MQMNGRMCMSIFRTTRLSRALSFRSGMYVESMATFCSAMPWSLTFRPIVTNNPAFSFDNWLRESMADTIIQASRHRYIIYKATCIGSQHVTFEPHIKAITLHTVIRVSISPTCQLIATVGSRADINPQRTSEACTVILPPEQNVRTEILIISGLGPHGFQPMANAGSVAWLV